MSTRRSITLVVPCALVAFSALAVAQTPADVECKKTETQPECHARLKCKANEELEDCQRRLLRCTPNEKLDDCKKRASASQTQGNAGQGNAGQGNAGQGNAGQRDTGNQGGQQAGERRERDNPDQGRERRGREEDAAPRRERGGGGGGGEEQRVHRRAAGGGGGTFQANKTFGLGLELGEPSGFNGKYFVSDKGAFDFGLGVIYDSYYYGDGFHVYGDYLYHPVSLVSAQAFELPLYIGGGLRYWNFHYCFQRICDYGGSALGIRIPFGVAFDFNNTPLDIFIQLVPVIDFVYGDYYDRFRDRAHVGIDLSVGIRYWFK